jgi:hypothetical protein
MNNPCTHLWNGTGQNLEPCDPTLGYTLSEESPGSPGDHPYVFTSISKYQFSEQLHFAGAQSGGAVSGSKAATHKGNSALLSFTHALIQPDVKILCT